MLITTLSALALLSCFQIATAQAPQNNDQIGMFDASDPGRLARYMQRQGYEATLGKDEKNNPMITGRLSRTGYSIQFYECERGEFCNSVQFFAWAPVPETVGLEALNTFNASWRYARASIANNQLRLQMDLNLDAGVTTDNFRDTLDIWRQLIDIFERELLALPSPG